MSTNVPTGAATPAASDKYHVYRPMLDLIGLTEGTDRKRGYNETLAYGAYTGGDGSRMPSAIELDAARYQGAHVAKIASKLG